MFAGRTGCQVEAFKEDPMSQSMGFPWEGKMMRWAAGAAVIAIVGGCAHVNRDELAVELDQIRTEIREGDDRLAQEIRSVESRMESRMNALEADLRSLRGEFTVAVERFESAIRFSAPVHFAFDDATVRAQDREILDRFAGVVQGYYGDALITVEGFTDPAGSVEYNQRLGEARARSVMEYLAGAGIPRDRMRAVSYGATRDRQVIPGAQGPGDQGWQNRRVAMVIDFGASAGRPSVALQGGAEDL
jgi:outer membrane protein OmpA-like peptidoglycan-associated protein